MIPRSQLFLCPPAWIPAHSRGSRRISLPTAAWLFETGSLTKRLRSLCGREFRVRLLTQRWAKPFPDEVRALDLHRGRLAMVREVLLQCGDRPLVAARSIMPQQTLLGVQRRLAHLGTRPLGEILFADPRLQRTALELAEIDHGLWQRELRSILDIATRVWGRRSLYTLGPGHTLLVAEFFLPELFARERNS